jgi:DNA polymerase-3 subunit delta
MCPVGSFAWEMPCPFAEWQVILRVMSKQVHTIVGDDEYRVSEEARRFVRAWIPPESNTTGLETVDGRIDGADAAVQAIGRCLSALQTGSLFGDRRVVWLNNAAFLGDVAGSKNPAVKARLDALALTLKRGLPDGTAFLLTAPKMDRRTAFCKAMEGVGAVQVFALPEKSWQLEQYARSQLDAILKEQGLRMREEVKVEFLGRVGTDTRRIASEVEKLRTCLGAAGEVGVDSVRAVTSASRESSAWDLTDAVGARSLDRALEILRQLLFQKESPISIVLALQSKTKDMMLFREALDGRRLILEGSERHASAAWQPMSADQERWFQSLAKDPRQGHPFFTAKMAGHAAQHTPSALAKSFEACLDAHERMVGGQVPQATVLELLLVKMLS